MLNWNTVNLWLIPIKSDVKKRETSWICSCGNCFWERTLTYAQAWNIIKGNSPRDCSKCLNKFKPNSGNFKKGIIPWNKGKQHNPPKDRSKNKAYMLLAHTFGIIVSEETKLKQRNAKLGKLRRSLDGLTYSERRNILSSRDEYRQLRKMVFKRDDYTCQICKIRGGKLELDHIKEWCNYPELRYELTNCRCLCQRCHKTTDNYGHKARKKNGLNL